ncbi:MAG TPA: cofactor-independent phosphoglycerate mutase [Planctomycetaceae bacterium]|nr:cofactor-independent phosphoglycerate mutase [Planctomycetaceae bacterium]
MKIALVIPDGVADEPQPGLSNRTPLQAATIPFMDEVAALGHVGQTDNVPASMPSGSDVGTMSLFGYSPLVFHTGRAPLEAAAQGIELHDGDWAIRCNLVTVTDERMTSFTAGQFPSEMAQELIKLLQHDQCGDSHWKFHPGVSYRNLLMYRSRGTVAPFARETDSTPPHDITDQPIAGYLPAGPGAEELIRLMNHSRELFANASCNQQRIASGELPATQIWLWGLGQRPTFVPFLDRFKVRGAVITAVDLLRGIGRLLGWEVVEVKGATGYLDTDYAAKGRAAIETLSRPEIDFVVVHVEATDEASHEGHVAEKVRAVENIDRHIVGPLHAWLKQQGDYRLLICPDHPTFLRTRTHSHGFCPFAMCGTGVTSDAATSYSEVSAAASPVKLPHGWDLMSRLILENR